MADFFDNNPYPFLPGEPDPTGRGMPTGPYPYPQDFPGAGGLPTTTVGGGGSVWGGDTGGGARSQGWPPGWPTQFTMQFPNPASSEAARQAAWQRYDAGFNFDGTQRAGAGSAGGTTSGPLAGMSEQQQFQYAMQQLGLTGADLRRTGSKPVTDWLTANGVSGWQGGGPEAADWVKTPSGQEIDYLNANGDAFQWTPDAGSGGGGGAGAAFGGGSGGGQLGLNGPFGATPFDFHYNPNDPAYQFIQKEVLGAIQNSQFARGTGLTGGAAKELQDRAAGLASMEYGNEFDRQYRTNALNFSQGLAANQNQFGQNYQLAGLGLNATTGDVNAAGGLGATGSSYANQVGSLYGDIGNVNAGSIAGNAQARNNFYTGLLNGLPVGSRPYNAY